jgi:hypothetical protein
LSVIKRYRCILSHPCPPVIPAALFESAHSNNVPTYPHASLDAVPYHAKELYITSTPLEVLLAFDWGPGRSLCISCLGFRFGSCALKGCLSAYGTASDKTVSYSTVLLIMLSVHINTSCKYFGVDVSGYDTHDLRVTCCNTTQTCMSL